MLCALVKKRRPAPHSAPPPSTDKRQTHSGSAHEATCSCLVCTLAKGGHRKYSFGFTSPETSSGPGSAHGPACACTVCSRIRAHAKPQTPGESSQEHKAIDLWNRGQAALALGETDTGIRLFTQAIGMIVGTGSHSDSDSDTFVCSE